MKDKIINKLRAFGYIVALLLIGFVLGGLTIITLNSNKIIIVVSKMAIVDSVERTELQ